MKKNLLSIMLATLMLFSNLPANPFYVRAEENAPEPTTVTETADPSAGETGETPPPQETSDSLNETEEPETVEEPAEPTPETEPDPVYEVQEDPAADEAEDKEEAAVPEETADTETAVTYVENGGVYAVQLYGKAAEKKEDAVAALQTVEKMDEEKINETVMSLFAAPAQETNSEETPPRSLDGSNIEGISVKWITEDTVSNDDDSFLYVRPSGNNPFSVRLQIDYALSGEHNYAPGDITITIPANIIHKRNGSPAGITVIPFPEDPSTKNDFNWKLVGEKYILTNTKRMSAATKGYVQIAFDELLPHELVDMEVSDLFDACIEVVTHKGNTIALRSNSIKAQFDTEARIIEKSAVKRPYSTVERIPASSIPPSQRIEGENEYIKVNWYMWVDRAANTEYTLDIKDVMPAEYNGFVIGATTEDGLTCEKNAVYSGHGTGQTSYYNFSTAYPASQFEPDTDYTFHNNVTFTLTEKDPDAKITNPNVGGGSDPRLVTTDSAYSQIVWNYTDPKWYDPSGHFMVTKNGNDDTPLGNQTHHRQFAYSQSDAHLWSRGNPINGWYGIYPSAINELQDLYEEQGDEASVRLSYTMDSVGYVMPWMFDETTYAADKEMASRRSVNYSRPVTMVTADTGVSVGRYNEKLIAGQDYDFVEVEIPEDVWLYTGVPQNINPDGSFTAMTAGDGTFNYLRDNDKTHYPDILLEVQKGGKWQRFATVSWKSGSYTVSFEDGSTQTASVIKLPEGTENIRTSVTLQNTSETAAVDNKAIQAAIDYDVRVVIDLYATEDLMKQIGEAFENSNTPELFIYNSNNMTVSRTDTSEEIVSIDKDGYDSIRGYTTDTAVYPYKSSTQRLKEADFENRLIKIHYSAKIEERSVINDKTSYEQAIADGRLDVQRHGFWYDLLPKGVTPDLDTIRLRENDRLLNAYTIENYKETGRTMLVVEAELTPTPERYRSGDMYYYEDVPKITFDAIYGFDSYIDFGDTLHNVIAFEGDTNNEHMGTIDRYTGEPDDPSAGNNIASSKAFADAEEKKAMTDLDPDTDKPLFVYAGTTTKIDLLSAARLSLSKDVQVNNDGFWSEGTWEEEGDEEYNKQQRSDNERVVYEGGQYSYRLRMMPNDKTVAKNMIIYDSLENFYAADGNSSIDIGAPRWQGYFRGVDVSQLEAKGCAPVVYYSTVSNLQLSDENDKDRAYTVNTNLENADVWVKAEDYTGSLEDVKAIAVDASRKKDGTDFVLQQMESVVVIINMQAPAGEEARTAIAADAHAYNNAYLIGTTVDVESGEESDESFIRKDYTKVGIREHNYSVSKIWDDDNDRDGIRPDSVIVHLYRDGKPLDPDMTAELNEENGWSAEFEHIPYTDPEGNKYHYSVVEEEIEGYTATLAQSAESTVLTNYHEPEKISLPGEKTWVADEEGNRPESITVNLYGNDKYVISKIVRAEDDWKYTFKDLYKYENGEEIVYRVEEQVQTSGKGASYTVENSGMDVINTYHPKGDLSVSKTVLDTTEVSEDKEFTFTFTFTKKNGEEESPVLEEYDYDITDQEGNILSSGRIGNNGTLTIHGGDTILVKEVDEYVSYTVTEAETEGFKLSSQSGQTGTIQPNTTTHASFTNTYSAKGQISLQAQKVLKDRELKRYQFRFELYKVETDEEGNETETLFRTASNSRPGTNQTVTREDGTVESSAADVLFGAIRYTQEDHGKTFHYRVKESDTGKNGYVYDYSVYDVFVTVTDNGDGTLKIEQTYSRGKSSYEDTPESLPVTDGINIVRRPELIDLSRTISYMGTGMIWTPETFESSKHTYQDLAAYVARIGTPEYSTFENTITGETYDYVSRIEFEGSDARLDELFRAFADSANGGWTNNGSHLNEYECYEKGIGKAVIELTSPHYRGSDGDFTYLSFRIYPKASAEAEEAEEIVFTNKYKAVGETVLRAWKDLTGRKLKENEFAFELLDEEENVLQTKANSAEGSVAFDPLHYTQNDIGKTYYYGVREKNGSDSSVNYDKSVYWYTVTVIDNGDGTLSIAQGQVTPVYDQDSECQVCHGRNAVDLYIGEWNTLQQNPEVGEKVTALMQLMSENGTMTQNGNRTIMTCDTGMIDVLKAFNTMLEATGHSERAGADETMYVSYVLNGLGYPSISAGYYCSVCGGLGGKCPVCKGTGSISLDFDTTTYGTGTSTQTWETWTSGILSNDYSTDSLKKMARIYARLCEIGEPVFGTYGSSSSYLPGGRYWHLYGLPYSLTERCVSVSYKGNDAVLAGCFGIDPATETTYSVSVRPQMIGHGGSVYYITASCDETLPCETCSGTGKSYHIIGWEEQGELPVFTNTLRPGSLSVSKYVTDAEKADPEQEFTFRVKLIGEGIEDGEKEYTVIGAGKAENTPDTNAETPASNDTLTETADTELPQAAGAETGRNSAPMLASPANANEEYIVIQKNSIWGVDWKITASGEMIIGNGGEQTLDNTRYPYSNYHAPWDDYKSQVRSIRFDGTVHGAGSFWCMFYQFPNLETINFSGLDTFNVTDMSYMLGGDSSLKKADLSGLDTTNVSNMFGLFLKCSSLEEASLSQIDTRKVTDMGSMFEQCPNLKIVDISGLNTQSVSNMNMMFADDSAIRKLILSPYFRFKGSVYLYSPPSDSQYTGKWIREDEMYGPYTAAELTANYTSAMSGTWIWQEKPVEYTVRYTAEEGTAGSMVPSTFSIKKDAELSKNRYLKYGHDFDHWTVAEVNGEPAEPGTKYRDQGTIPANTYKENDAVTLQAVFVPRDLKVQIKDGEFTFTLRGGEKAVFDDLPAGTAYQVYEETPDGWVLVGQSNTSGTIEPLQTANAEFTNKYQPGTATAQFSGTKTLDGQAAEKDSFSFYLTEEGAETITILEDGEEKEVTLPLRVSVLEGGFIQFPVILYAEPGEHTYTIAETDPQTDTVDYDTHAETVKVSVTGEKGSLTASVTYDEDRIAFANKTRPGSLRITKAGRNLTDANKDDEFTFKITLTNEKGLPLSDDEVIYWYLESDSHVSRFLRAANILSEKNSTSTAEAGETEYKGVRLNTFSRPLLSVEENKASMKIDSTHFHALETEETDPLFHADESMLKGRAYAVFDGDRTLTFFRSYSSYSSYSTGTFTDINGNQYSGTVYSDFETRNTPWGSADNVPWSGDRRNIRNILIAEGQAIKPHYTDHWFEGFNAYMSTVDLARLDTSDVKSMNSMFRGMRYLSTFDVGGFDTSNVTDMSYMFYLDGMGSSSTWARDIDVSHFDTSKVTNMSYMFYNGSTGNNIEYLDVSGWDTSNVTDMSHMFDGLANLKSLDVSNWDTSNVTNMASLFYRNASLTELDVSKWDTSNVTNMSSMFAGDQLRESRLTSLDVSHFDTSKVTDMSSMFCYLRDIKELDLSSFDTSGVTSMTNMFHGCKNITYLDLSGFDTTSTVKMQRMFEDCYNLTELDISGFDTRNTEQMFELLQGCSNLQKVHLGPDFVFKKDARPYAVLPNAFRKADGLWIREDEEVGPYTAADLRDKYDGATMSGTWVWYVTTENGIVIYDANEGTLTGLNRVGVTETSPKVTLPDETRTSRYHYTLTGWNTEKDGSGENYDAGSTYTVPLGKTTTLYAQWETSYVRNYKVLHYQENADLSGYTLVETINATANSGESVTPPVRKDAGFVLPEAQTVTVADDDSTVVEYYYQRQKYTVHYDGNSADFGQMKDQTFVIGISGSLNGSAFAKKNSIFTGWNTEADGNGQSFTDKQRVTDLAKENGAVITLYAQWLENSHEPLQPENSVIYVKAKAGDTVIFPVLPEGTKYTIEEVDIPAGWTLVSVEGGEGTIHAGQTGEATLTNRYQAEGVFEIVAHKTLAGEELREGQFSFELLDSSGRVLQTKTNGAVDTAEKVYDSETEKLIPNPWHGTAPVVFDELDLEQYRIGTHTFYVREVSTEDGTVETDERTFRVDVTVSDAGSGILSADVVYEETPLFVNRMSNTELEISKTVEGEADKDTEFSFTLELKDKNGDPLTGEYPARKRLRNYMAEEETRYSHTPNVSDDGTKTGDYGNNLDLTEVVTIPGAAKLDITITYGGENYWYDWVCMWEGAHADYNAYDYSSSLTKRLGGGDHTSAANTVQYTVEGDSVTFAFRSDGSGCGRDGYGYYAVIKGIVESGYEDMTVSSGSAFTLKDGESLLIRDLPHGASYSVREEETRDWVQVSAEGSDGTLEAGTAAAAHFVNRYEPAPKETTTTLQVNKKVEGGVIEEEDGFLFELQDTSGNALQTKSADRFNESTSTVTFDPLTYGEEDAGKTFEYYIQEKAGSDPYVQYDRKAIKATVTIREDGENLIAEVSYDSEDPTFVNKKFTDLVIEKTIDKYVKGLSAEFSFRISYTDEKGEKVEKTESLSFSEAGAKTIRVERILAGTEVTVTETDSGKYYKVVGEASKTQTLKVFPDDIAEALKTNRFFFENELAVTSVKVTKSWSDNGDPAQRRQAQAMVQLYKQAEGSEKEKVGDPVAVGTEDGWTHTFTDLPVYENGKQLTYSAEETMQGEKYQSSVSAPVPSEKDKTEEIVITNTQLSDEMDLTVRKAWNDVNNKDGLRPEKVVIRVLANGEETGSYELNDKNSWTVTLKGLAVKDEEGKDIVYSVSEDPVPGYTTVITGDPGTGFTVTNSHTPGTPPPTPPKPPVPNTAAK
ncbi:MAG: BspA family leucine-rich repeat surface protein [Erysipelotrichaceae bacterium]|nr:BspA family leucine-rich repeat surface protein [Erysipelotrichaceae bacterium]